MGDAIGQALPFAVGVAISPVPIIAVVLMLGTPRARVNGLAFVAGWIVGLAVVGAVVLLAAGGAGADDDGGSPAWVGWVKLLLGALLLVVAARQWRGRPRGDEESQLPGWMRAIDRFTPARSGGMGVALSAVNPKNLLLVVGAAAAIAQTGISTGGQLGALAVFVAIATLGPGIPLAIYVLMGERAEALLGGLKAWMSRSNTAIMVVLCAVIGAKLLGDGLSIVS